MLVITNLKQLYETDNSQWLEETVKLLKDCQFEALEVCALRIVMFWNL
jgi:hypothetical protein